jgi:Cu/Ag efflux protein CusF
MKSLPLTLASVAAFGVAACGGAEQGSTPTDSTSETPMNMADHDVMEPGEDNMTGAMEGVGHSTGTIRSVGNLGDFLTIEHGPFYGGIKMDAMTMGFDIMGDVDLTGFSEGDTVAFMVKQGRDGSYRIMALCNTGKDGADCLDGMMDH